jgi:hypothetical protein
VKLVNGHKKVGCRKCHTKGNLKQPKGTVCVDCHKPVHEAKFGRKCQQCHSSIQFLGIPETVGREAHSRTPFPLRGKHRAAKCVQCHPKKLKPQRRFRELEFKKCTGCHKDKHKGEFKKRDGGNCAQCHSEFGYLPTSFGFEAHKTTEFPLEGKHMAAPCAKCHTKRRPRLDLRVKERKCRECHDNPHGDQFAKEMRKNGCATCHSSQSWLQPKIDHSTWPLEGRHADTACESCHTPSKADKKKGGGATYRGLPKNCEGCHEDTHAGQFRLTKPFKKCDFCHDNTNFEIKPFDHEKLAAYALEGKHAKLECEGCHSKTTLRNGKEAVRYRLFYRGCKDCHANPHPD